MTLVHAGADDKQALRTRLYAWRASLTPTEAQAAGAAIAARLPELAAFGPAHWVLSYCAIAAEVATEPVIAACRQAGKSVCVPVWRPTEGCYAPALLAADTPLRRGPLGIAEPAVPEWVPVKALDLALVPGLAFDRQGGRLGHGGGHFDRLLAECSPGCCRVGLAFDGQMADAVPMDAHDVRMNLVMTQTKTWICDPVVPVDPLKDNHDVYDYNDRLGRGSGRDGAGISGPHADCAR